MTAESGQHPRVLIADDQPDVLEALRLLLKPRGFAVEVASSPAQVIAMVQQRELDLALVDLNYTRDTTSGQEGLDLLARLQALDPSLPVVVMTATGVVLVGRALHGLLLENRDGWLQIELLGQWISAQQALVPPGRQSVDFLSTLRKDHVSPPSNQSLG